MQENQNYKITCLSKCVCHGNVKLFCPGHVISNFCQITKVHRKILKVDLDIVEFHLNTFEGFRGLPGPKTFEDQLKSSRRVSKLTSKGELEISKPYYIQRIRSWG